MGSQKRVLRGYKETACIVKGRDHSHEKTEGINLDCRIQEGFMERLAVFTGTYRSGMEDFRKLETGRCEFWARKGM